MGWVRTTALVSAAAVIGGAASAQQRQTGPVATYWMSAQTTSGFMAGAAGMGQGQRPSMGAMMGMMTGTGPNMARTLTLQLGSARKASGAPEAAHLPPAGLRAGQSLPLVTPRAQPSARVDETPDIPRDFQRPKGRMLIYWGCGPTAKAGQPITIDFAQMSAGKTPPGLEAMTRGLNVTPQQPPSPSGHATYGEWPNERTRTTVPASGSLAGEHVVQGNYSPEIRFSLNQNQDFLAPLRLSTTAQGQLSWGAIPNAQAYLATAVGAAQNDTLVLWTSSEVQASAFSLPEYISPGDLSRLVASKALMNPQTTRCQIPQEVIRAAPNAMVQLVAYGGEANFSYPPRPSDPKQAWNIEWTAKVRYRSSTGAILGMDMPGGGMADEEGPPRRGPQGQPQQPRRPSAGDVLRGIGRLPGL